MSDITTFFGNKGYAIIKEYLPKKELELIKKELTVTPFVPKTSINKPNPFYVYRESKTKIFMPKFYGIENYGEPDADLLSPGETIDLKFNGELRDYQVPIVDSYIKAAKTVGGGLLEIYAGAGKTCMGLNIISKLKVKTLIVVHKEFLLRQWIERIQQFLPHAKVGKLQSDTIDIEGKDIVIGMLQSISMREYEKKIYKCFGLTIYDECHHVSAEVFSRALFNVTTKYTLGLSATMNRKDGLTKVIKMFLGDVVYKLERKNTHNVVVKAIYYESEDEEFSATELNFKGQTHYSKMIKKLCEFSYRTEFVLDVLKNILANDDGNQQIIILGHNKNLLKYLHDAIDHRNISTVGYYIGGMKEEQLKESETKKVIIGTYAMAEEGLDIKTLTTLIMATPRVDVTQAVGRILRKKQSQAEVYDIVDQHPVFQRHFAKRKTFYRKQNFSIIRSNNKVFNKNQWETIYDPKQKKLKFKKKGGKQGSTKIKIKTETSDNDPFMRGKCLI